MRHSSLFSELSKHLSSSTNFPHPSSSSSRIHASSPSSTFYGFHFLRSTRDSNKKNPSRVREICGAKNLTNLRPSATRGDFFASPSRLPWKNVSLSSFLSLHLAIPSGGGVVQTFVLTAKEGGVKGSWRDGFLVGPSFTFIYMSTTKALKERGIPPCTE